MKEGRSAGPALMSRGPSTIRSGGGSEGSLFVKLDFSSRGLAKFTPKSSVVAEGPVKMTSGTRFTEFRSGTSRFNERIRNRSSFGPMTTTKELPSIRLTPGEVKRLQPFVIPGLSAETKKSPLEKKTFFNPALEFISKGSKAPEFNHRNAKLDLFGQSPVLHVAEEKKKNPFEFSKSFSIKQEKSVVEPKKSFAKFSPDIQFPKRRIQHVGSSETRNSLPMKNIAPKEIFVARSQAGETRSLIEQEPLVKTKETKSKPNKVVEKVIAAAQIIEADKVQATRVLTAWKNLNGSQRPEQETDLETKVEAIVREKNKEVLQDLQVVTFAKQMKRMVEAYGVEASQKLLEQHNIDISVGQVVKNVCNLLPEGKVINKLETEIEKEERLLLSKKDQPELICFVDDLSRIANNKKSEITNAEAEGRDIYTNRRKATGVVNPMGEGDNSNIQINEKTHEKICMACLMILATRQLKLTITREELGGNN